jgi:hypothetical protein
MPTFIASLSSGTRYYKKSSAMLILCS